MAYILGIDIGTSSVKAIAAEQDGTITARRRFTYPIHQSNNGNSEQNPELVLAAVKQAIKEIITERQLPPKAISFSAAMHSIMMMDKDGHALTPLLIWADNRSLPVVDQLQQHEAAQALYHETGVPLHPMLPLCKIIWWREQAPDLFAQCHQFIGIKEFILFHFLGRYVTDLSTASATGLLNIHSLQWHEPALQLAGIRTTQLPVLAESTTIKEEWQPAIATELNLPASTPCVIGATDGCLAQYGSNALDAGHVTLTIGTSGAIRMALHTPATDPKQRLFTYAFKRDLYITGGAINNGGLLLQWYIDTFMASVNTTVQQAVQQALTVPAGADGLLCLPYLYGERAPIWDAHAKATFIGVKPTHGPAYFIRAMLEGMAFSLLAIIEALEDTSGPLKKISVSGGFTNSPEWIQLLADIFGRPMHLQEGSDASALGAVRIGYEALQLKMTLPDAKHQVFEPISDDAAIYKKNYPVHHKAYMALKVLFTTI